MGRRKQDYVIVKRTRKSGTVYHIRWPDGHMESTGASSRNQAHAYAREQMRATDKRSLGRILETAYLWDECPHVRRVREEGGIISERHAANQRSLLERYVIGDRLCGKPVRDLTRGDMIDLRSRVRRQTSIGQTNKAVKAVATVLAELVYRGELEYNPAARLGNMRDREERRRGVFSAGELHDLFGECPGVWGTHESYAVFCLAATTGMRRGEILALTWGQVDFDSGVIHIDRAMKGNGSIGRPKWERIRATFLAEQARTALLEVRNRSLTALQTAYVFPGDSDGHRCGKWWHGRFRRAMLAAEHITQDSETKAVHNPRNLVPHSLRHSMATLLRTQGIDPAAIRASMGWASEAVQEGYTHWGEDAFADQRTAVEELFG